MSITLMWLWKECAVLHKNRRTLHRSWEASTSFPPTEEPLVQDLCFPSPLATNGRRSAVIFLLKVFFFVVVYFGWMMRKPWQRFVVKLCFRCSLLCEHAEDPRWLLLQTGHFPHNTAVVGIRRTHIMTRRWNNSRLQTEHSARCACVASALSDINIRHAWRELQLQYQL